MPGRLIVPCSLVLLPSLASAVAPIAPHQALKAATGKLKQSASVKKTAATGRSPSTAGASLELKNRSPSTAGAPLDFKNIKPPSSSVLAPLSASAVAPPKPSSSTGAAGGVSSTEDVAKALPVATAKDKKQAAEKVSNHEAANFAGSTYFGRATATFVKVFARKEAPGTTDCAEFTYHNAPDCQALCESIPNVDVKRNCAWYATRVNLCSATEYEYATESYKGVGVPLNLKSKCDKGESVMRCKICDRAINFDEQNFVHDDAGYWPFTILQSDGMRAGVGWVVFLVGWALFFSVYPVQKYLILVLQSCITN
ncbi:unnamed protein product, partial [Amoebophrya sp. A120]|eukprot:GSA120T00006945001.1